MGPKPFMCTFVVPDTDAITLKAALDLTNEIGNFSPKLEKVLAFLLGETKDIRDVVKRENDVLRSRVEK